MKTRVTLIFLVLIVILMAGCQTTSAPSASTTTTTTTTTSSTTTIHNLSIVSDANNYVSSSDPTGNYSSLSLGIVGYYTTNSTNMISFIKFDVSSIPTNAIITSATMKLYVQSVYNANVPVIFNNLQSAWDETTICWNNMPAFDSAVGNKTFSITDSGWIEIDLTDCVQNWVNGTTINNGLRFKSTETTNSNVVYYYKANSAVNKPKLEIVALY